MWPGFGGSRRVVVGAVAAVALATLVSGCGGGKSASSSTPQPPAPVSAAELAKLPQSTTFTKLDGLPQDPNPFAVSDGLVVHPTAALPVYAKPGGSPVAALPDKELGSPTWVPVVEQNGGWERVLLPSRPNRSTGWIYAGGGNVQSAHTPYVVKVEPNARRLTVIKDGQTLGTWTVAVGAPNTPTPDGRTFLLASLAPPHPTYSPLILPLGTHSASLDTFGGGPGTVAFHGWPDKTVFGKAISHGCVRVPADALKVLSQVPLGSPVIVQG